VGGNLGSSFWCSLPTEAAGLIGMDFLKESGAIVNFECNKMSPKDIGKAPRANGTALNKGSAFTIFVEGKEGHSPQPNRWETQRMDKQVSVDSPRKRTSSPARTRLVRVGENVTMAPRSQNMVKAGFRKAEKTQNANLSRNLKREKNPGALSRDYVQQERSKDAFCRKRKPGSYRSKSEIFLEKDDVKYRRQRKTKPREFEVQDLVCLYHPTLKHGLSKKFAKPWSGPWQITKKIPDLNYEIVDKKGKRQAVHVNRLKKAYNLELWKPNGKKDSEKNAPKRVTRPGPRKEILRRSLKLGRISW
jgi:hypothetical protein